MTRALKTVEIKLPFAGFYYSVYDSELDSGIEHEAEYMATEPAQYNEDSELAWPEALQIEESDIAAMLHDCTDFCAARDKIARDYCDAFSGIIGEALGISAPESVKFYDYESKKHKTQKHLVSSLRLTFAALESPRSYNFQTDGIFANVPVSVVRKLWAIVKGDKFYTLTRVAEERHSSRDGFISGYRRDWQQWGALVDWDHNQLETLLIAACEVMGADWEDSDLGIYYSTVEGGDHWRNAMNWPEFEEKRHEKRVALLAEWLDSDPEGAKAWIGNNADKSYSLIAGNESDFEQFDLSGIAYRCPKTPDLFAAI